MSETTEARFSAGMISDMKIGDFIDPQRAYEACDNPGLAAARRLDESFGLKLIDRVVALAEGKGDWDSFKGWVASRGLIEPERDEVLSRLRVELVTRCEDGEGIDPLEVAVYAALLWNFMTCGLPIGGEKDLSGGRELEVEMIRLGFKNE